MFNEEFRALRRNLYALDHDDVSSLLAKDLLKDLRVNKRSKVSAELLESRSMKRPKKVLLLGAGGMGMAPLALYLKGAGVRVEAYDDCFASRTVVT